MKTLLALLTLFLAAHAPAQGGQPTTDDGTPYGIYFYGGVTVTEWPGIEGPLVLMWSHPWSGPYSGSGPGTDGVIVALEEPLWWPSIEVGIELVGYAAWDPQACAVGTTVRLRDTRDLPCELRTWDATIGADGMAYHFPHLESPLLRSCQALDGKSYDFQSLALTSVYPGGSKCYLGVPSPTRPFMGFILCRLVLL